VNTLQDQQENAERMFYAAVGAPVVFGQKAREFGKALFSESFEDFETAGRQFAAQLQENRVMEQIQESVDVEQFQEKVDALREQLESLLSSWRDQFDARNESVKIEVDVDEAPKKTSTKTTESKSTAAKKTSSKE
jgi:hypothetical protein